MTTPDTLTQAQAEDLLRLGRARRAGTDCLLLPRATYQWQNARGCYERVDGPLDVPPPGHPIATTTMVRRVGTTLVWGGWVVTIGALLWFASVWGLLPKAQMPKAQHCLWYLPVWDWFWDLACVELAITAAVAGRTPYSPLVFWAGLGVVLLGLLLRARTRPARAATEA